VRHYLAGINLVSRVGQVGRPLVSAQCSCDWVSVPHREPKAARAEWRRHVASKRRPSQRVTEGSWR
jgi:hypothetical protein